MAFKVSRGALFTTPDGTASFRPPAADPIALPPVGLGGVLNNPTYGTIFKPFSQSRLFSAVGSNITDVEFFVPSPDQRRATVTGFGSVFTDVDQPDGGGSVV